MLLYPSSMPTTRIEVTAAAGAYPVVVGCGVLDTLLAQAEPHCADTLQRPDRGGLLRRERQRYRDGDEARRDPGEALALQSRARRAQQQGGLVMRPEQS